MDMENESDTEPANWMTHHIEETEIPDGWLIWDHDEESIEFLNREGDKTISLTWSEEVSDEPRKYRTWAKICGPGKTNQFPRDMRHGTMGQTWTFIVGIMYRWKDGWYKKKRYPR